MEQQTKEWLKWRHGGLGSSDYPVVMGVSPWKTRLQLFEEKILPEPPENKTNWAMERGIKKEASVRAMVEVILGESFEPDLLQASDYPFMRVSLDGANSNRTAILEIKVPGKADHATAMEGRIPDKYYPQIQGQLLVSGAKICHYCSWDTKTIKIVEIKPDAEYQKKLLVECEKFWLLVQKKQPPEPCEKDFSPIHVPGITSKVERWRRISAKIKELESEKEDLEKYFKGFVTEKRMVCSGLHFVRIEKVGSVDYGSIPELSNVNLNDYRKPSSSYIKISDPKEGK
jgi:putative phage-type endonuclease